MTYTFKPEDIIILVGLIVITLQDPFRGFVVFDSYSKLKKKIAYAPPPAVFGIVWFILYVLLAVAIFLVFLERASLHTWVAYVLFSLYALILICTKTWVPLFFGLHDFLLAQEQASKTKKQASYAVVAYVLAFLNLVLLLIAVVCFIIFSMVGNPDYDPAFWVPGLLLSPMALWLLYAGYLNMEAIRVADN